ncbi:hypothetical protein SNE26_16715 [Mucilaginibacter sp. cycad4]|uniref:hypothetical protein n=1 Tax=Mucilaginibacter sp. cycad4 TaxID=3342096 RepID=UPI002AAB5DFF|nr:hypothetical protein [Mucilaginibacter gossypii]WPU97671.1 hypothetical protein SNE26_16715 [Mucilaginibacter gossypii]
MAANEINDLVNTDNQVSELKEFIKQSKTSAKFSANAAVTFILLGIIIFFIPGWPKPEGVTFIGSLTLYLNSGIGKFVIASLIEIAAIFFISAYKRNLKQINIYNNELIVLRDLNIALNICNYAPATDFDKTEIVDDRRIITRHKSQRSKMQQAVIEALLNRCGK